MTLNEMILEVWQNVGEPTDIDPTDGTANPTASNIDDTSKGYTRITRALNQAQLAMVTYRFPRGRLFRWNGGYLTTAITVAKTTDTLDTDIAADDLVASTNLSGSDDDWNGWIIRIGTEVRRVIDSTAGGDLTVRYPFSVAHDSGDTVELAEMPLSLPSNLWVVRKILDYTGASLEPAPRTMDLMSGDPIDGDPSYWFRQNQNLYFDSVYFDGTRNYTVQYRRFPLDMSATQESEIPANFHWGLVLWAAGWGQWRQQDSNERKNLRDDFHEFMRVTQTESMMEFDATDRSGSVREDYYGNS